MKKLILVAVLLVIVLIISWWARGSNFSLLAMMQHANFAATTPAPSTTTHTLSPTATPIPIEIIITVTPNGFVPDVLMVAPGTKITWVNKTPFTANISSNPPSANSFLNAGDFGENGSVSVIFPNQGRYNYYNGKNTSQTGTIVVK